MSDPKELSGYVAKQLLDPEHMAMGSEEFGKHLRSDKYHRKQLEKLGYKKLPPFTKRIIKKLKEQNNIDEVFTYLDGNVGQSLAIEASAILDDYITTLSKDKLRKATEKHVKKMENLLYGQKLYRNALDIYYSDESIVKIVSALNLSAYPEAAVRMLKTGLISDLQKSRKALKKTKMKPSELREQLVEKLESVRGR